MCDTIKGEHVGLAAVPSTESAGQQETCPICGETYIVGVNGMGEPSGCDSCLGIQRDKNGYAWSPDETTMELEDVETGARTIVTREQAFGLVLA
jgi:hypothetical protein